MRTSDSLRLLLEESDLYFVQRWCYKQRAIISIHVPFMSLCVRNQQFWFPTRSDTNRGRGCTITMLEFVFISRSRVAKTKA